MVYKELNTGSYEYTFTVFTPTYNRAHTLNRVYESLLNQTFKDFEWLIVDDGSADDTDVLVDQWCKENKITIRYIKQINQGKHVAMDNAIQLANGFFFLTLDSDDACVDSALEKFVHIWNDIPETERNSFSAVTTLCLDESGNPLSNQKFKVADSNSAEMKFKYKFETEAWGFQKTDVLKEFRFNTKIKNSLVPEAYVWFQIAKKYKTRYVNEYLRIYYRGQPSLSSSKVSNKIEGAILYYVYVINNQMAYFKYAPLHFIYYVMKLSRYSFHNNKLYSTYTNLNSFFGKFLFLATIPLGLCFFIYDKLKSK